MYDNYKSKLHQLLINNTLQENHEIETNFRNKNN